MTTAQERQGTLVSEAMTRDVLTVRADQPIDDAVQVIVEHGITGVPVVDENHGCVGIISESDVLGKHGATVGDIMTAPPISVEGQLTLAEAAEIILTRRIRRLPVTDEGRLVGILTRTDLLRHFQKTLWTCSWCNTTQHGLRPPNACAKCGGESFAFGGEAR
jgi:CBS domain-containing protein